MARDVFSLINMSLKDAFNIKKDNLSLTYAVKLKINDHKHFLATKAYEYSRNELGLSESRSLLFSFSPFSRDANDTAHYYDEGKTGWTFDPSH